MKYIRYRTKESTNHRTKVSLSTNVKVQVKMRYHIPIKFVRIYAFQYFSNPRH